MNLFASPQKNSGNSSAKSTNSTKKKKKAFFSNPNTAQKTIPYKTAYDNGLFETEEGIYSKCYGIADANFEIVAQDVQDALFDKFGEFLNSFNNESKIEVTVYNRTIDKEQFNRDVLLPMQGDMYDVYRDEQNKILLQNLQEGRNNIRKEIYITVSLQADNYEDACSKFAYVDGQVDQSMKYINVLGAKALSLRERLSLLYDIYHPDDAGALNKTAVIDGQNVKAYSLSKIDNDGTSTKDLIAPGSFIFNSQNFQIGETYGQTLYVQTLPSYLSTNFMSGLNSLPYNMLISYHLDALEQGKALKMIRTHLTAIKSGIVEKQQKAARQGYSPDLAVPYKDKEAQEESEKLLGDLSGRNQKLYYTTFVITHFANDLHNLDEQKKQIIAVGQKHLVNLKVLTSQQEWGLSASLPLGVNKLALSRLLTTEAASLFLPFSTKELFDSEGIYYGLNAISHNIVMYDRRKSKNANGIILGTPGSGKSFAAKREMLSVLLSTNDDVFVIDPEGEYTACANTYGGEIIELSMGSGTYINPLDMDLNYGNLDDKDNQDPITLKADQVCTLCETIVGGKYGLSVTQKSIIDRCTRRVYEPYVRYMNEHPELGTCDLSKMPTLKHLYNEILKQEEPEAKIIALALERYVIGSYDMFAHRTNVNVNSRFVVYNIKNIGRGMKELGVQVCLNDIWNRTIANRAKGKRTWFYIDEFYLLVQTESSALFLQEIFKRARKWGGVPTGITQNVSDLFTSQAANTILSNSDFVLMFNQAPSDRVNVAKLYNISPVQLTYISNSPAGQGLFYNGETIVPIVDKYPKDTISFAAMTSNMSDQELQDALKQRIASIK